MTSWIDTRQAQSERANLTILFDKYVPYCLEQVRCNLKTITPIPENSMVQVRTHYMLIMCLTYRPRLFINVLHTLTSCLLSVIQPDFFVCVLAYCQKEQCVTMCGPIRCYIYMFWPIRHCVPCWTAC